MPAIIDLKDITFTYAGAATPALQQITLAVEAGQICAVVGRAGAGKSTLCALCSGFIPNFYNGRLEGSASIDGQDVIAEPVSTLVRHVALVGGNASSQISGACATVYEEVGFTLQNLGVPRPEMIERIDWALAALKIEALRDRSPYELSGGQQQRLVIAAALALRPPVLVLDEPTAQLDPLAIEELAEVLQNLAHEGTTILFAEHRLEWAAGLAGMVVALDQGRIIASGTPHEVFTNPLLLERQIGWPRPTLMADRARSYWPEQQPLPITTEELIHGLVAEQENKGTQIEAHVVPPSGGFSAPSEENKRTREQENKEQNPENKEQKNTDKRQSEQTATDGHPATRSPGHSATVPILQIEQVAFRYPSGVAALRGVSLAVGAGERIALLGRNGAGKSTLVRHMNGLLRPASGRVLVAGTDTRSTTVARCAKHIGIVFQDIRNQLFARTVRDELQFGPRNLGYAPEKVEAQAERALQALGLSDAADMHPYDLPAPRRRLVAIAAVVAMDTSLLVLDEPTAGLDTHSIELLAALIQELAREGKSIIVVSHDLDFCFETLERVALLRAGDLVLDVPAQKIDGAARAVLADAVGLPVSFHAIEALGLDSASELAELLAPPVASVAQKLIVSRIVNLADS